MSTFEAPASGLPAGVSAPEDITQFVAGAAAHAPSVHNTQPWWFAHGDQQVSVHADTDRRLRVADPDGREMMISCGAAVFTARLALRYLGLVPRVAVLPDPDLPNLVARVAWSEEKAPPVEYEQRLFAEVERRRTHRGGFDAAALPPELLEGLREEAEREGAALTIMAEDSERALAAVVEAGDYTLRLDSTRAQEEARWSPGPASRRRDGVPPTAYPARPERTEPHFPSRDFAHGHGWGLPPSPDSAQVRSAGVAGLLTTSADNPDSWIRAGQGLQRILLLASSCGVSAALHSQPLEVPQLRDFIRVQLGDGGFPQMVLRFGVTSEAATSVRLPLDHILL